MTTNIYFFYIQFVPSIPNNKVLLFKRKIEHNIPHGIFERRGEHLQPPTKIVGKAENERLDYNKI